MYALHMEMILSTTYVSELLFIILYDCVVIISWSKLKRIWIIKLLVI